MTATTGPAQGKPAPTPDELPGALALLSAAAGGRRNVMTTNRVIFVSPNPMVFAVAVRSDRHTYELIKESGEFVINVVSKELLPIASRAGKESGRNIDKFATYGLETRPATHVGAPLIAGCPCNIECKLVNSVEAGDRTLFIGEMVALHVNEGVRPIISFHHGSFELSGDPI